MDSRVAQLQHVIFLKDQMILELQTQLAAYEQQFGVLPPSPDSDAATADAPPGGINTAASAKDAAAAAAKEEATESQQQSQQRRRLSSTGARSTAEEISSSSSSSSSNRSASASQDRRISSGDSAALAPPPRPASVSTSSGAGVVATGTGKNVVLDFVEDSPMFRRQLEGFEESLGGLRGLLKEVLARTKEYVAAGRRYGDEENALAEEIVHRKYARALFTTSCPELGSLSSIFNEVHDTVAQIQSSRVSMLLSIDSLLSQAIFAFSEQELREATDLRKEVGRLADEYEALLSKLLAKPKPSGGSNGGGGSAALATALAASDPTSILGGVSMTPGASSASALASTSSGSSLNVLTSPAFGNVSVNSTSVSSTDVVNGGGGGRSGTPSKSLEREVTQARLKFEMARFDLVRYLNRLDCQKKFLLIECFNSTLYAFLGHFHACHELVKSVEPAVRQRQEMLQQAKRDFEEDDQMWRAQRETLEARLRLDFESSSDPATRTFELPVEVISQDTLSSRESSQGAIIKQGYLFLRNSLFPARSWKRRWFQIHSGKLYQNRGRHMDLALVCDLMLSRVRESSASNLPYCFEIIDSSQNKFLLQATSEADLQDWVDAARRSTESMLEKQSHRMSVHPEQQSVIDEIVAANGACADCGQAPAEWVSINIGCLLCIECSGIHRSLGVHVSKVRSLTLDSWEMPLLLLLRDHLGNAAVNAIWEHTVPPGWTKPAAAASHDDKVKWVKAKYHFHGFAEFSDLRPGELIERFLRGGGAGQLRELMWCLAHGVDVNVRNTQRETALHGAARCGAAVCCDYLVLNGASLVLPDAAGKLPSDAAGAGGFEDVRAALTHKPSLDQQQPVPPQTQSQSQSQFF